MDARTAFDQIETPGRLGLGSLVALAAVGFLVGGFTGLIVGALLTIPFNLYIRHRVAHANEVSAQTTRQFQAAETMQAVSPSLQNQRSFVDREMNRREEAVSQERSL